MSLKHFRLKLITAGDYAVGKTSLVKRYLGQGFSLDYGATVGVECINKSYKDKEGNFIDLSIWDLAGQVLYRDLAKDYARNADLIIIVFDVTRKESFDNVTGWYKTIFDVVEVDKSREITPCMIIGNKIDLRDKRVVDMDEGLKLSESLNSLYVETSAKEDQGVDEAFNNLIIEYIRISKFL
ncbi:MAG: Rab family GTPase [Candidatus Hodarchaeota archaeon]